MQLVMMGTGPFAVPSLLALHRSHHEVVALFTRPTAAVRSRGKPPRNPMREAAAEYGIPTFDPPDINNSDAHETLRGLTPELFVVCDYGQILSAQTLTIARLGGINLHGSLLPKYRGAAPVQWAVLCGEKVTGTTVIHMTPKLDAGPTLVQRQTEIGPEETAAQLEQRLADDGVRGVLEAIEMLQNWDGESELGTVQDNQQATRAPRLNKRDGEVDWNKSAVKSTTK